LFAAKAIAIEIFPDIEPICKLTTIEFRFCGFETSFYGSATNISLVKFGLVVQKNGIYLNNIKLHFLDSQQRFVIASASNGIECLTHLIKYGIVCSPL